MKSTAPDGTTYSVTRRWMPWRRRIKGDDAAISTPDWAPSFGEFGDDPISAALFIIIALVLAILFLPGVLLLLGLAVEVALLLALLPVAVLARVLLGHPWEVEVRATDTPEVVWPVVHAEPVRGWVSSGHRIAEIVEEIRLGRFVPRPAEPHDPGSTA